MTDDPLSDRLPATAADRRRRTAVRGVGAAALVTAVAAMLVVPALVGGDEAIAPTAGSVECVGDGELTSAAEAEGDVIAVRFCGRNDGQTGGVRFPDGALTGDAAARFVAGWPTGEEVCGRYGGREWLVQVRLSSGDAYQRRGNTRICADADAARQLLTGISDALADDYESASPTRLATPCPDGLRLDRTNTDGDSAELLTSDGDSHPAISTTPLLALPATQGLVCEYSGTRGDRQLADSWQVVGDRAETLRIGSMLGYIDGMTDCSGDPAAASYVVVLRDRTGTARTFSIDGTECSPMSAAIGTPAQEQYLGLALSALTRLIEESRG